MPTYKFNMEMACEGCANAAKNVLKKLGDKIQSVETDVASQTVTVETELPQDEILKTLEKTQKKITVVS
ncbi:Heavy metal-associated domain HMA-containing protein [Fasciola gigantica]|uniref:Copper transport protein ATOX1 n=1 Tax=Fasciola gigantica TaxID=46835 RepID=A0A504YGY6_FASGI|nr:Heavy metal-associated domain HMA-containing protein [Fasciola gigantica]